MPLLSAPFAIIIVLKIVVFIIFVAFIGVFGSFHTLICQSNRQFFVIFFKIVVFVHVFIGVFGPYHTSCRCPLQFFVIVVKIVVKVFGPFRALYHCTRQFFEIFIKIVVLVTFRGVFGPTRAFFHCCQQFFLIVVKIVVFFIFYIFVGVFGPSHVIVIYYWITCILQEDLHRPNRENICKPLSQTPDSVGCRKNDTYVKTSCVPFSSS